MARRVHSGLFILPALFCVPWSACRFLALVPPPGTNLVDVLQGGRSKGAAGPAVLRRLSFMAPAVGSLLSVEQRACAMSDLELQGRTVADMADAQLYLSKCGIPAGLPELSVVWGGKGTAVHGKRSTFRKTKDVFLQSAPAVTYDAALGKCTLVMVDPDAPAPKGDGQTPGSLGPVLHWLVTDCTGGRVEGGQVAYAGPAPPFGTHRYIQVLFQQTGDVKLLGNEQLRLRWDFPTFVMENAKSLTPFAVNCFYCSSQ